MGKIISLVVILVAGGIWLFFGTSKQKVEAPIVPQMKTETQKAVSTPALEKDGTSVVPVQEIAVEAHNWYFVPEEIRVRDPCIRSSRAWRQE